MVRRWWLLAAAGIGLLAAAPELRAEDAIATPPAHRVATSADQRYRLVLQAQTDPRQVSASFYETTADRCLRRWSRPLPQEYGPRHALVGENGELVLLDEWISVRSPYALVLLDAEGETVLQQSFEDLQRRSGIPAAELVEQATSGWWISSPPELSGQRLTVGLGTQQLSLDLQSADLQITP